MNADTAQWFLAMDSPTLTGNGGTIRMQPQINLSVTGSVTAGSNGLNGIDVFAGNITQARTWGGPLPFVLRSGIVNLANNAALMFAAGAVIKFKGANATTGSFGVLTSGGPIATLQINSGRLAVLGTALAPVVMTSLLDDTAGGETNNDGFATSRAAGDWHGVNSNGPTTALALSYAKLRYGGASVNGVPAKMFYVAGGSTVTMTGGEAAFAAGAGIYIESAAA